MSNVRHDVTMEMKGPQMRIRVQDNYAKMHRLRVGVADIHSALDQDWPDIIRSDMEDKAARVRASGKAGDRPLPPPQPHRWR